MGIATLNTKSIINITPVNLDADGNAVNKGSPVEVTLADLIAFIGTSGTGVLTLTGGSGVTVDNTDPRNPVITAP